MSKRVQPIVTTRSAGNTPSCLILSVTTWLQLRNRSTLEKSLYSPQLSGRAGGSAAPSVGNTATAGYAIFDDVMASRAIDSVVIRQAAIGTAAIDDLAVTSAKIDEVDAGKVKTGELRGINVAASSHVTKGSYLTAALSGGETTVPVKDTTAFPDASPGSPKTAWMAETTNDRDAFTYTGKTATTLTGCTGVLAHNSGAVVMPAVKGMLILGNVNEMRFFGDRFISFQ